MMPVPSSSTSSNKPRGRAKSERERGSVSVINVTLFAALVLMLAFAVALSFPALRTTLNMEFIVGNLPAPPAVLSTNIRISEAMSSNGATLPDENGAFHDWIELINVGSQPESLAGFTLSDKDNQARFVFPNIMLDAGAYLVVFASGMESLDPSKPLHAAMGLSSAGDMLYLNDREGRLVESIAIPALRRDQSYARTGARWNVSHEPTPGYDNTPEGRTAFVASLSRLDSPLQLNELMASNSATLTDEDGDASDWIELFNPSATPIELNQYALSDDPVNPVKWRFPDGAVIQPYSTYLLFASGKSRAVVVQPHTSFKLRADHGVVILSDLMGNAVDSTEYDNLRTDMVWSRRRNDAPWEQTSTPSPGMINP